MQSYIKLGTKKKAKICDIFWTHSWLVQYAFLTPRSRRSRSRIFNNYACKFANRCHGFGKDSVVEDLDKNLVRCCKSLIVIVLRYHSNLLECQDLWLYQSLSVSYISLHTAATNEDACYYCEWVSNICFENLMSISHCLI